MNNALTEIANLPANMEEVETFVKKAVQEVKSGEYDKDKVKNQLYFSILAFRKIRNIIG